MTGNHGLRTFASVLLVVFATEAAVMLALPRLLPAGTSEGARALVDSLLLSALCAPLLWAILIRPLSATAALESARSSRLAQAVEASADAILITDANGRIESVNRAFTVTTGFGAEEAVGSPTSILKSGIEPAQRYADLWRTISAGGTWSGRLVNRRRDGSHWHAALTISPIRDGRGRSDGFVGVERDVGLDIEREERLAAAVSEAEKANEAKSLFLATMSHEIRTPMNGVIGMTELLLDTRLDDEQRDYLESLRNSGEALLVLINDILDFSKIEAGKMELERAEYDPCTLSEDVVDLLRERAHDKGLELSCRLAPDLPQRVLGDACRVRQVLTNLVGNAVKFTAAGEVAVSVSVASHEGPEFVLRFEVRDTGIGISAEDRPRLFEAFTQADASTTRRFGGTGLGLVISRQLSRMMGGSIGVESVEGAGSTFWFTIRVPRACESPAGPQREARLADRRALVVDDCETNRRILLELLRRWGMECVAAEDGEGALRALRQAEREGRRPDVVVLDYMMPGMDGLELARRIRAVPLWTDVLLLLLTSTCELDVRESAGESGVDLCLTKPVRRARLRRALSQVVEAEGAGEERPAARGSPGGEAFTGRVLVAEDNPVNRKLVVHLLAKMGLVAETVATGLEAVAAAARERYDLILMDCLMPEMDGLEATRAIRAGEGRGGRSTPIVALTASAMAGDRERCLEAGMDDYLAKPLRRDELRAVLARWLAPMAAAS